jgi:hypothetical protein
MDFMEFRVKMDLIDENVPEKIKKISKIWIIGMTILTVSGFLFSALSFNYVHHVVGIAVNSFSTCFLQLLNLWMDKTFSTGKKIFKAKTNHF